MKRLNTSYIILLLVVLSFMLRMWDIGAIQAFRGIEEIHIPGAKHYVENGHTEPENWRHPPFGLFVIYSSVNIFGDNSYGWRMTNVVFGTLSVFVLILVAREVFTDMRTAYLTGLFLLFDPLHILLSRTSFIEIQTVFYFLAATFFAIRYTKGHAWSPVLAGLFIGFSVSTRWYFLPAWFMLFIFCLLVSVRKNGWKPVYIFYLSSSFILVPLTVYMLSFSPWFGRGYSFIEFLQFIADTYRELQATTMEEYKILVGESGSPWEWFVQPLLFGYYQEMREGWGQFLLFMNNPPVWFLTLPSLAYVGYFTLKRKDYSSLLPFVLFMSIYFQFILVERPVFLYSALSALPFSCLLIAWSISSLLQRFHTESRLYWTLFAFFFLWGLYLFPLVSNRTVPVSLYAPILAFARINYGY